MLRWAVIFSVVAFVAAVLGFCGSAGEAASLAKILFFIFLIVAPVSVDGASRLVMILAATPARAR